MKRDSSTHTHSKQTLGAAAIYYSIHTSCVCVCSVRKCVTQAYGDTENVDKLPKAVAFLVAIGGVPDAHTHYTLYVHTLGGVVLVVKRQSYR